MRLLTTRRRSSSGGASSTASRCRPWIGMLCLAAATCLLVAMLRSSGTSLSTPRPSRRLQALSTLSHMALRKHSFDGRAGTGERVATLYHSELVEQFKTTQSHNASSIERFITTVKEMEAVGITTVALSTPWDWFNPEKGQIRFDYLNRISESVCQHTTMKVAFMLDMARAPGWVFESWPDAKAMDSHGRPYPLLSWFHVDANKLALEVLSDVVKFLTTTHRDCVTSVQPVYNNEYEAKYTQEHDCFQDYSPPAVAAFRTWVQSRRPQLGDVNARWGTNFSDWAQVTPPVLEAGSFMGVDLASRYWDFMKFRELYGAQVLNRACAAVRQSGARCFHQIPNLFSVLNAVYGVGMFKHIASSPDLDYIVMGSNFRTSYGTVMEASKIRMDVSAARSYGKPVYFQAAVDPATGPNPDHLASAYHSAWRGGAEGLGLSNWLLHRYQQPPRPESSATSPTTLASAQSAGSKDSSSGSNASASSSSIVGGSVLPAAAAAMMEASGHAAKRSLVAAAAAAGQGCSGSNSRSTELVGVFLHLDSCAAFHGLQWGWARKDPVHDFVQDLADRFAEDCGADVAVFLELDRFLAALPALQRVVFVEPVALYGSAELESYVQAKAAIRALPHEILQLPANQTNGVQLTILQEL